MADLIAVGFLGIRNADARCVVVTNAQFTGKVRSGTWFRSFQENSMAFLAKIKMIAVVSAAMVGLLTGMAQAASCGSTAAGFEQWKADFANVAKASGVKKKGLSALAGAQYATATIKVDRAIHKAFSGSVESFMQRRGSSAIISKGRSLKKANAALFDKIERTYGVSPGVLLAIWGMETGFGSYMGKQNTVSAIVTLAYDCRRPAFFEPHAIAALILVDQGALSAGFGRCRAWRDRSHPVPAGQRAELWRRQQEPARQGHGAGFHRKLPQGEGMAARRRPRREYGRDRRMEFGKRLSAGDRPDGRGHRRLGSGLRLRLSN